MEARFGCQCQATSKAKSFNHLTSASKHVHYARSLQTPKVVHVTSQLVVRAWSAPATLEGATRAVEGATRHPAVANQQASVCIADHRSVTRELCAELCYFISMMSRPTRLFAPESFARISSHHDDAAHITLYGQSNTLSAYTLHKAAFGSKPRLICASGAHKPFKSR